MARSRVPEHDRLALAPAPYRVVDRRQETADTWTLELEPGDGRRLDPFEPGQFSMLYSFGAGEVPISLSAIGDDGRLVHTIRAVGAVSSALAATEPGQSVGARGPFGSSWPLAGAEEEGADLVIVAGGLGLPPLRPVIHHAMARRERFGEVSILYGGRSPDDLVHRAEVEGWQQRDDLDVQVTVDAAGSDWRGRVGLVTTLIETARFDPARAIAMIVGPEVMMRFTVAALMDRGVPAERIWVSLERSMKCATAHCGHCMIGPEFVCKDGPVFRHDAIAGWLGVREL
jgi:anaerobic sulfite reductase subunit B